MTYAEFLRKVYEIAKAREWPWLCVVAVDTQAAYYGAEYTMASEHCARLLRHIRAQLIGHTFMPEMLREQRPDWPYPDADGKVIRLAWLREQIELAEAEEAGACTPT